MPTLETIVDGLKLPNPFVIGSGPPGTNGNVIGKAFDEGWGAVICKTISLEADKVTNVQPRYARLRALGSDEIIGWENIELISDRPFSVWMEELKAVKDKYPDRILIASVMEEFRKDAWVEIIERCEAVGVDAFELNFSCPHGLPERKMGSAMGENPEILEEVCKWVNDVATKPVWAKMTPNVTHIEDPARAALKAGCEGIAAINTIRSVLGVNLETLRPEPSVEGYTTPGGYSCRAVLPIALRMVMEIAKVIRAEFPGRTLSGIGGVETGGDAAQFILLGADTVQVCTGVMKHGYPMIHGLCEDLLKFMEQHKFETLADFRGHSVQYFTTHFDLVKRQAEARAAAKAKHDAKKMIRADDQWSGDEFVAQSDALARMKSYLLSRASQISSSPRIGPMNCRCFCLLALFGALACPPVFGQTATVDPPTAVASAAPELGAKNTPLDKYIAAADDSYAWRLETREETDEATLLTIELTSQTWRREGEIDRPTWKHWVSIVIPRGATSDVAMLYIGGGRNGSEPNRPSDRVVKIASATGSVVVNLGQVPNQPLVFRNDGRGRTEDDLVARSWVEAMKTSDPTWMAQMPMAKAAVRAMDATQAAVKQYGFPEVKRFVVAGGSKRGWTTWLAAAVDPRVAAIAPIVIDVLNVQRSMQNHRSAYGFWAQSLDDYSQQGLTLFVNSPFATMLFGQVDPYSFRDRMTMPKCIINATGDQFFTPDSSKLYYDDLPGEKMLCYVPNADHSLADTDAMDTLIAFHASVMRGLRRPKLSWEQRDDGTWLVSSDMPPTKVLLWQAANPEARDFRVATIGKAFTSRELTAEEDGRYAAPRPEVSKGWVAYFVQMEFDIGAPTPLRVTSPVWITPDTLPYADGSSAPRSK